MEENRFVSGEEMIYQRAKLRQELQIVAAALEHPGHPEVSNDDLIPAILPRIYDALRNTYVKGFDAEKADADVVEGIYLRAQFIAECCVDVAEKSPKKKQTIKECTTTAEYMFKKWLLDNDFELDLFDICVNGNTALVTDGSGDSMELFYNPIAKRVSCNFVDKEGGE